VTEPTTGLSPARRSGVFGPGTQGMPPWIPRLLWQVLLAIILFLVAFNVLQRLRGFLILVAISFFLSTALEPGVAYLAKRGWRRGLATGLLFAVFLILTGVFVGLMVPLIVDQTQRLIDQVPSYLDRIAEVGQRWGIDVSTERIQSALTGVDSSLQRLGTDLAGSLFGVGTRLLNSVFQLLTIALFTFYITADAPRMRRTLLQFLPPERQREVLRILDIAIEKTGGYFYSRALLATGAAVSTWAALVIIGVPFAIPLGLWVGVLSQFVPVVGTYLGGLLPVMIALLQSPGKALAFVIFIALYQQVENYLLAPRVTAHTMSLHPAIAFGSAIVGGTLMGAPGALMALPVAATIQAFVSTYLARHQVVASPLTDHPPPPPSARIRAAGSDRPEGT
jgi:predicted PurR-regulated permease PerM